MRIHAIDNNTCPTAKHPPGRSNELKEEAHPVLVTVIPSPCQLRNYPLGLTYPALS